ncbi:MAG: argininosuccinate synthase [Planctomycetes bacterium]|nr:argininosuccinate synthase [Planctomycetota bacterium]
MEKVVFAYSGGVDNLICIHYLQSKGFDVITFLAQLGQINYLEPLGEKAVNLGATVANIADLRRKFIHDFILPALHALAVYDNGYLLAAALSRPLIAEELVNIAEEENCKYVAHGARGIGNDHARFNNCINALNPKLKIISPLIELELKTTKDDLKYIKKHGLQIDTAKQFPYNIESNLWGVNIQLGPVGRQWSEPQRDTFIITTPMLETVDKAANIEIRFDQGTPIALDGKKMDLLEMVELLNNIGGRNAVGRIDMIENKISGEKIREIYEAPAATILYAAYSALCGLILPKEVLQFQSTVSTKYAELIYNGSCSSPLKKALDKYFQELALRITGSVKLRIYKGNLTIVERKS